MIEATNIKEGMKIKYKDEEWAITNVRLRYKDAWFRGGKGGQYRPIDTVSSLIWIRPLRRDLTPMTVNVVWFLAGVECGEIKILNRKNNYYWGGVMYLEDIKVGQRVNYRGRSYTITKNIVKQWKTIRLYPLYLYIKESTNYYRSRMYFQRVEDKSESLDGFWLLYDDIEERMNRGLIKFLNMSKKNNYY